MTGYFCYRARSPKRGADDLAGTRWEDASSRLRSSTKALGRARDEPLAQQHPARRAGICHGSPRCSLVQDLQDLPVRKLVTRAAMRGSECRVPWHPPPPPAIATELCPIPSTRKARVASCRRGARAGEGRTDRAPRRTVGSRRRGIAPRSFSRRLESRAWWRLSRSRVATPDAGHAQPRVTRLRALSESGDPHGFARGSDGWRSFRLAPIHSDVVSAPSLRSGGRHQSARPITDLSASRTAESPGGRRWKPRPRII